MWHPGVWGNDLSGAQWGALQDPTQKHLPGARPQVSWLHMLGVQGAPEVLMGLQVPQRSQQRTHSHAGAQQGQKPEQGVLPPINGHVMLQEL